VGWWLHLLQVLDGIKSVKGIEEWAIFRELKL
jgi:hypothetical protein